MVFLIPISIQHPVGKIKKFKLDDLKGQSYNSNSLTYEVHLDR